MERLARIQRGRAYSGQSAPSVERCCARVARTSQKVSTSDSGHGCWRAPAKRSLDGTGPANSGRSRDLRQCQTCKIPAIDRHRKRSGRWRRRRTLRQPPCNRGVSKQGPKRARVRIENFGVRARGRPEERRPVPNTLAIRAPPSRWRVRSLH